MNTITVVCSTRKIDDHYVKHVMKSFSHPKNQYIFIENNGDKSLTQVYNEGLEQSKNDIVVFIHDDLEFETKNLTPKIIKLFDRNHDYGIIGLAGTDNLLSGKWWEDRESMYGQVGHINGGKRYISKYSGSFGEDLKEVVVIDGLFMMIHKSRLKSNFDTQFDGFHFYDLPICLLNHLEGVKIGVTTKIKLYHKSIGEVDKKWSKNKLFFEALYEKHLPLKIK
jgi:glycosyltransferase involved in cell wall biosynthesis